MNASKSELNSTFNQVQRMSIANATPYSNMKSTVRKKPTTCHFCGLSWTSELVTNAQHGERNAIIVGLKIVS